MGTAVLVPIADNAAVSITLNVDCPLIQYALPLLKPIELQKMNKEPDKGQWVYDTRLQTK